MDYVRREFFVTVRRLLAAALGVGLLVAFWADRPAGSLNIPAVPAGLLPPARGDRAEPAPAADPPSTSILSLIRRPWLGFYTLVGAPSLAHGKLTDDERGQFRTAVLRLAVILFALGAGLWWRGRWLVVRSRRT